MLEQEVSGESDCRTTAITMVRSRHKSILQVASELGLNESVVRGWVCRSRNDAPSYVPRAAEPRERATAEQRKERDPAE